MSNVLYELNFDWVESYWLLTPLLVGLGFFFVIPLQNPEVKQKGSKGYSGFIFWKITGYIIGTFLICLWALLVLSHVVDYQEMREILDNDQALVVEGIVENYHAMPKEGHDTERFEINGVFFEFTSYEVINGYNTPACDGGVIKENGQHLKIKYFDDGSGRNIILYIEEIE